MQYYGVNTNRGRRRVRASSPQEARTIIVNQGYSPYDDPMLLTMEMMTMMAWMNAPVYGDSGYLGDSVDSGDVQTDGETGVATSGYDDGGTSSDNDTSYDSSASSYDSGSSDSGSYDSGSSDSGGGGGDF